MEGWQIVKILNQGRRGDFHLVFRFVTKVRYELIDHLGKVVACEKGMEDIVESDAEIAGEVDIALNCKTIDGTVKWFDEQKEKLAAKLFDLSLTHTIVDVEKSGYGKETTKTITFRESQDGQTNITSDVIEEMLHQLELKKNTKVRLLEGLPPNVGIHRVSEVEKKIKEYKEHIKLSKRLGFPLTEEEELGFIF